MKRFFRHAYVLLLLVCISSNVVFAQQAKYVFFFIGDGMGINQVNGTEMYLAEMEGRIGVQPLCFPSFPIVTVATTFSATNSVTDSAAGGTALATGWKTKNGAIGVTQDNQSINSVAVWAKEAGRNVGIATSVSIDHATPAAFYAHQPYRGMYYEIATDLPKAGFDFYAGSGFLLPDGTADNPQRNVFELFDETGYTVAKGYRDFNQKYNNADKVILMQEEGADPVSIPYAIDRQPGALTLSQITESAIRFLTKNDNGFFLMVEGGKIDWACHDNDGATVLQEVIDMDEAVRLAYDFYLQHPEETLIVITADHETGGLGLGTGPYEMNLKVLSQQKCSQVALTGKINAMRTAKNNQISWEEIRGLLKENLGFWDTISLSEEQENRLKNIYELTFSDQEVEMKLSEYARNEPLAAEAKDIINEIARVGWVSNGHSAAYVPVFAIGAGAELFNEGKIDNIDIPKKIARAAGY